MRHDRIDLDRAHPLADRTLHAQQTHPVLIFHQLTDRANTTVAEMIDIVDFASAILQVGQDLENGEHIFLAQNTHRVRAGLIETRVHLDATDRRQIIALGIEEQALEQRFRCLERGRLAWTHDAINIDQRVFAGLVLIDHQRIADIGSDIHMIDRQHRQLGDTQLLQQGQQRCGQLIASLGMNLAACRIDDILRQILADQLLFRDDDLFEALVLELTRQTGRHLVAGLGHHLARLGVGQVIDQLVAALEAVRVKCCGPAIAGATEMIRLVEVRENFFLAHAVDEGTVRGAAGFGAFREIGLGLRVIEREQQRRRR